jgi:outer membrane protein assembly factor BamB
VDVHSGSIVWKYRSLDDTDPEESAPGFTSAPRVAGDAVYVGDEDGLFHAVDRATGKRKWVLETGDAITGRAAVADDRIVFGSYDSYLYCVNTEGSLLWKFQTEDRIHGSPAMAGEYALVAGCDQHVRVIDVSAGEQVADISLDSYLIASPAVAGDEFYIGTYAGDVVAVNWKDGRIAWQYKYEKRVSPYHASASVTDSRVFVGGRDKQFHCLNRSNGARVWTFSARAPINSSSAVVGDRVFFGSDDGNLYGLRTSDGEEIWRFRAGKKITAGVAAGDGHLVVGEEGPNGNLYCFAAEG